MIHCYETFQLGKFLDVVKSIQINFGYKFEKNQNYWFILSETWNCDLNQFWFELMLEV